MVVDAVLRAAEDDDGGLVIPQLPDKKTKIPNAQKTAVQRAL